MFAFIPVMIFFEYISRIAICFRVYYRNLRFKIFKKLKLNENKYQNHKFFIQKKNSLRLGIEPQWHTKVIL